MRVLLDSNAAIRWMDERVPAKVTRLLLKPQTQIYISYLTPWEIATKQKQLDCRLEHVTALVKEMDARWLPIEFSHIERYSTLPSIHKDPFDRMLVAQALTEDLTLVTADEMLSRYSGLSVLWD